MSTVPDITLSSGKTTHGHHAIIPRLVANPIVLYGNSLLLGAICALCAPGFGLWWLAWIGFIPAFLWLFKLPSYKKAFCSGLLFGTAFHAIYLAWLLSLHPMDWLGFSQPISLLLAVSAWTIESLAGGIAFALLACVITVYLKTTKAFTWAHFLHWFFIPTLWLLVFHLYQTNALWFPWALLNYTQLHIPLMSFLVHLTGTSATITFLLVAINVLLSQAFSTTLPNKRIFLATGILALLALVPFFPTPTISKQTAHPQTINIYQGGVDIGTIKTGKDFEKLSQEAYITPLKSLKIHPGGIIILPEEGIVPGWVDQDQPFKNATIRQLQQIANNKQTAILSGISSFKTIRHKASVFNSTILLQPHSPAQFYDKNRLVPFGESVPYLESDFVNKSLEALKIPYQFNFKAGTRPTPLVAKQSLDLPSSTTTIGSLVCFELIYPELSSSYKQQGAHLLANSSNLGWFHQSPLLSQQFLAIGQIRSLETGLPLALVSNNGPSAIITPDGHIQKQISKPVKASLTWRIKPLAQ